MRTLLCVVCAAASLSAAHVCDSGPEVRRALRGWDEGEGRVPFAERLSQLEALAAKYPDGFEAHATSLWLHRVWRLDTGPLRDRALQRAAQQPEDPVALTVAAMHLHRKDTPGAIELARRALTASPGYPWAALTLAEMHSGGRFEDLPRAREYFTAFVAACPDRLPQRLDHATGRLATSELRQAMARAMRTRLEAESDPEELLDYERLWALEFRMTPPAEHGAVRERVARDVTRLAAMDSSDPAFLAQLRSGAEQAGAPADRRTAFEDRLLAQAPGSRQAYRVAYERWRKQHPEPGDHRDADAWRPWNKRFAEAMKSWSERFPAAYDLRDSYLDLATESGIVGEAEAMAEFEAIQRNRRQFYPPIEQQFALLQHGSTLAKRGWDPARAVAWLGRAWTLAEDAMRVPLADDTLTEADAEFARTWTRPTIAFYYLQALSRTGGKEVPAAMRELVERPAPASGDKVRHLWTRARLAEVDGRTADALAYYQAALRERGKSPLIYRGVPQEDVSADARAFFFKSGGTEAGFATWTTAANPAELTEGRWETPKKGLPAFELTDLQGKSWKLKELRGKSLLINLWATWCGPCRVELPEFQKVYQQLKDRTGVQVLTFNVDEEVGLVAPFLQQHGYTFPVLLAADFVNSLLNGLGIPQNWIVDSEGKWIATQMGFDAADAQWAQSVLQRLEKAKAP